MSTIYTFVSRYGRRKPLLAGKTHFDIHSVLFRWLQNIARMNSFDRIDQFKLFFDEFKLNSCHIDSIAV